MCSVEEEGLDDEAKVNLTGHALPKGIAVY